MNLNEVKKQLNIDEEMMMLSEKLLEGEFLDWKKFKKTKQSPISEDTFCMLPHLLHMVEKVLNLINQIVSAGYVDFQLTRTYLGIVQLILKAITWTAATQRSPESFTKDLKNAQHQDWFVKKKEPTEKAKTHVQQGSLKDEKLPESDALT